MGGLETESGDAAIKLSCAFMEERLESLGQATLASRSGWEALYSRNAIRLQTFFAIRRLSINCAPAYVRPQDIDELPITVIDVWDESALTNQVEETPFYTYSSFKQHLPTMYFVSDAGQGAGVQVLPQGKNGTSQDRRQLSISQQE